MYTFWIQLFVINSKYFLVKLFFWRNIRLASIYLFQSSFIYLQFTENQRTSHNLIRNIFKSLAKSFKTPQSEVITRKQNTYATVAILNSRGVTVFAKKGLSTRPSYIHIMPETAVIKCYFYPTQKCTVFNLEHS